MCSAFPKPLHTVASVPMIERALRAGEGAVPHETALVVSPELIRFAPDLERRMSVINVVQDPPRGTGEAARLALAAMPDVDLAIMLFSDHPLLEPATIGRLLRVARESAARVTLLTVVLPDPAGYGRVVRDARGNITNIVERRDDDLRARAGPTEINTGIMALDAAWARRALARVTPSSVTDELYLTDLVALATKEADPGGQWPVVSVSGCPDDALGVNDRVALALAESRVWARKRERLMRDGVTMRLPETIVIDEDVAVAPDTVILPYTHLLGATRIGSDCIIGPHAVLTDATVGDRVVIRSSTITAATIAADSDVGPYAHLRGGSVIGPHVHIGNFAELKNANLASGVKVGHFSYIGDTAVGSETNIGAGTITANFDGVDKHRTEIGERAFIGSDTILRAPVRIGDDARTGAGSVVTRDVPDGATVAGVPARVIRRASANRDQRTEEG
jgi:bifunctional UDP-N-acetylglucosamine pyrophosphorylase/glucosamine-1-phosphate N-acetyltransferase